MNRIELIQKLIDERFEGNQAAFARAIGRSAPQVSHWLKGHKAVGDTVARNIELSLDLPKGYFGRSNKDTYDIVINDGANKIFAEVKASPKSPDVVHYETFGDKGSIHLILEYLNGSVNVIPVNEQKYKTEGLSERAKKLIKAIILDDLDDKSKV